MSTAEWKGYDKLQTKLTRLSKITMAMATPMLEQLERVLVEDNRKGILEGTDGKGNRFKPVFYRPKDDSRLRTSFGPVAARQGAAFGSASGFAKGFAYNRPVAGGYGNASAENNNGNLTTEQYKKMNGPPLAPRYMKSRIITNLQTAHGELNGGFWVSKAWVDFVDVHGDPILPKHINGNGVPVRDPRGVRPWGKRLAQQVMREWMAHLLQGQ